MRRRALSALEQMGGGGVEDTYRLYGLVFNTNDTNFDFYIYESEEEFMSAGTYLYGTTVSKNVESSYNANTVDGNVYFVVNLGSNNQANVRWSAAGYSTNFNNIGGGYYSIGLNFSANFSDTVRELNMDITITIS